MTIENYIKRHFKIEVEFFPFTVYTKSFKNNDIITKIHSTEQNIYYLKSGIVEFTLYGEKHDRIIDFFFEDDLFCALTSLILQKPTEIEVRALTDCAVEFLKYSEIQETYKHSLLANQISRKLTEQAYILKFNREVSFLKHSAHERYFELIKKRPEVMNRIPVKKIAEYLGIHPESLSRIRKSIS